jgi:HEAT repeats/PBS lyase HEAT-like repeat
MTLDADATARLTEFARVCKAAVRAVSLYPAAHPAIAATLARLTDVTATMTADGPFAIGVRPGTLQIGETSPAKPDPAVVDLSELLRRHLIGTMTLNAGADAASWRTLLTLLARAPEDVRADGGIARLWATAGGPSVEIKEIDYAEVLREKQGDAATLERIIAAALAGPTFELDDSAMRALLDIVADPDRLDELMKQLETSTAGQDVGARVTGFLNLLRGLAEYVGRTNPAQLSQVLKQLSHAAARLSAEGMLDLLAKSAGPQAIVGPTNVVTGMVDRMPDASVAGFVSTNVIAERGATERLAQAFQTLVPEIDRQRQLLALAQPEVAASELGQDEHFAELWSRVETMMTSYSDASFVSKDYARELSTARAHAIEVEAIGDDPPERIAAWVATVNDTGLRNLDLQLLVDLLTIEQDASRWRDVADTVVNHADDLVRVGYFDQAFQLADAIAGQGLKDASRGAAASAALERFGRGAMIKHVARHLRGANDDEYERFRRLCHAIGPSIIVPLAEVLSAEQDARSRRRLRDVLVGFGAAGRESVQQLMNAPNWEVRRTAAYLLREFGGTEGLRELQPLLTDSEPLVQREAIQALVLNGSEAASQILAQALSTTTGRPRQTLITELTSMRDERAAPVFCYLVRHLDRRKFAALYATAIDALGWMRAPEAVDALTHALQQGDWWAPLRARRTRAAAARALRTIGTPAALDALREASTRGSRGARAAAKTELGQVG